MSFPSLLVPVPVVDGAEDKGRLKAAEIRDKKSEKAEGGKTKRKRIFEKKNVICLLGGEEKLVMTMLPW